MTEPATTTDPTLARQPDQAAARAMAARLYLMGLVFVDVQAKLLAPGTGNEFGFDIEKMLVEWVIVEHVLKVFIPLRINITRGPAKIARLSLQTLVEYEVRDPSDADDCGDYAGVYSVPHAWPYQRSAISSLSLMAGLPPVTLPILRPGHVLETVSVRKMTLTPEAMADASKALADAGWTASAQGQR